MSSTFEVRATPIPRIERVCAFKDPELSERGAEALTQPRRSCQDARGRQSVWREALVKRRTDAVGHEVVTKKTANDKR